MWHNFLLGVTAGSLCEWKGILVRNLGFLLDMMTLLMALGHYVHIWWLHGMAFHLVDAVLFLNIRVNVMLCAMLIPMFRVHLSWLLASFFDVIFLNFNSHFPGIVKCNRKAY